MIIQKFSGLILRFLFFIGLLANLSAVLAQSHGLAFASHEAVQEERTSLDLTPKGELTFERGFVLSFELSYIPNQKSYFGYIFRLVDGNGNNIDFLCNSGNIFTLISGNPSSKIQFSEDKKDLFKKWNKISIFLDYRNQEIVCSFDDKTFREKLTIEKNSAFKILFGANDFGEFQTRDVPPMKIRNIQIEVDNEVKYRWPLNEERGTIAYEEIAEQNGSVDNPLWIKKRHSQWSLLHRITLTGPASVAFDPKKEWIYLVGSDSLRVFDIQDGSEKRIAYTQGTFVLAPGNQSYFDERHNRLYNVVYRDGILSSFDFNSGAWYPVSSPFAEPTIRWHFNKFYSDTDSSFYILNGYGKLHYKNEIRRYSLVSNSWSTIRTPLDSYTPRYLAALGEAEGGAYILGGYGSKDGQQVNNPKSLFDLVYLDVNKQQITPVYQLSGLEEGTAFANSLVVDEANRSYYGLIFSKHSFNSTLQLIHGSLDSASFTRLGHPLPYKFQDVKSFVDLFYCNRSGKFITVTLFQRPDKQTEAEIYTLESPPLVLEEVLPVMETNGNRTYVGSWLALVLLIIAGVVFYRYRSRTKKPVAAGVVHVPKDGEVNIPDELPSEDETKEAVESEAAAVKSVNYEKSSPTRNSIVLFGATQIFDDEGNDITNLFTPLIKELFLLILLYSLRWEIGISSGKLKEVLWLDKSEESARNNRSVNLAKLKGILTKLNHCEISKKTGYWKTDIDHAHLYVDYYEYLNIVKETRLSEKEKIKKIAEIVQRGSFLSDLNYEWLDSFKSEISNEVIDIYLKFAHSVKVSEDPEFLIKVANYIFHFDAVNEEAMTLKCRALAFLGKHSLAKVTFEQFTKEYHRIYGEEFTKGFQSILED